MASDFTEHLIESECPFTGRLLRLRRDQVRLPDGATAEREYVLHQGAAIILALWDDYDVLLEHQFRYPVGQHFLELPAGKIEPGEPPLETARRELLEETGYVAEHWRHLTTLYPTVGYSSERVEFYLARGLGYQGHPGEADEFIEVVRMSLDEALQGVLKGEITEAKTILGLLWADRFRRGLWS